jgi:hypothetical protein
MITDAVAKLNKNQFKLNATDKDQIELMKSVYGLDSEKVYS